MREPEIHDRFGNSNRGWHWVDNGNSVVARFLQTLDYRPCMSRHQGATKHNDVSAITPDRLYGPLDESIRHLISIVVEIGHWNRDPPDRSEHL